MRLSHNVSFFSVSLSLALSHSLTSRNFFFLSERSQLSTSLQNSFYLQVFNEVGYLEAHQPCVGSCLSVKWQTSSSPVDYDDIVIVVPQQLVSHFLRR